MSGDFATTRALLSDDVTFAGPMAATEGADDYVSGVERMSEMVTGVELQRLIVEGDDVCIMYDLLAEEAGPLHTVGWYHFRDDKIDSVRAYFDPRPLTEKKQPPQGGFPQFAASLQVCADI